MTNKYLLTLSAIAFYSCAAPTSDEMSYDFESTMADASIKLVTDEGEQDLSKKRVVVIAGQSNAIGWAKKDELNPELLDYGFSRTKVWSGSKWVQYSLDKRVGIEPQQAFTYETENPNDMLYIVKYAVDATSLEKGKKHWHPEDKAHYQYLVEQLYRPALDALGEEAEVMAMLWFQGESDSLVEKKAERYSKNLNKLYDSIKKDMPEVKNFVIGGIPDKDIWMYQADVRGAQEKLAAKYGNVKLIDTDKVSYGDTTHYDAKGYEQIVDKLWLQINSDELIR